MTYITNLNTFKFTSVFNYFKVYPQKKDVDLLFEIYELDNRDINYVNFNKFSDIYLINKVKENEFFFHKFYNPFVFKHHINFNTLSFINCMTILRHFVFFIGYGLKFQILTKNGVKYNLYSLYKLCDKKNSISIKKNVIMYFD